MSSNKKKRNKNRTKKTKDKVKTTNKLKLRISRFDGDRVMDTLMKYIIDDIQVRLLVAHKAYNGYQATQERGMLVATYTKPANNVQGFTLLSPAEQVRALQYWPESRLIQQLPQYAPGRLQERPGCSQGARDFFKHDPDYKYAVDNHRWPSEALFLLYSVGGEEGSQQDWINMNAFGMPFLDSEKTILAPLVDDPKNTYLYRSEGYCKVSGFGKVNETLNPYQNGKNELKHDVAVAARCCCVCLRIELSKSDCNAKGIKTDFAGMRKRFKRCGRCLVPIYCSTECTSKESIANKIRTRPFDQNY